MIARTPINQNDEIDLIAVMRVLWEFKFVVIISIFFFVVGSIYVALTATSIFRADVVVAKVSDSNMSGAAALANSFGGLGSLMGVSFGQDGPGRQAQAVLESRRLAEEFVIRNDLLGAFSSGGGDQPTLWQGVKQFRELVLTIHVDDSEGLVTVSIDWPDPEVAALWANHYVALANELIRSHARDELERNIEYLNKKIEETDVVQLERVMYSLLETETKTLMLANARAEYAFTVIDPAVPPELRSSPKRKLIVLSGGALGLFFGVAAVFAFSIYRRIRPGNVRNLE